MIIDDDDLISVTCWRCAAPLIGLLWCEPGIMIQCPCSGMTRLPPVVLQEKGVGADRATE